MRGRQNRINPHLLHLALEDVGGSGGSLLLLQLDKQRFICGAVLLGLRNLRRRDRSVSEV